MVRPKLLFALLSVLGATGSAEAQNVFVVSFQPGPGVFSPFLQVAIDAAGEGDIVFVKEGVTQVAGGSKIIGKSLTIVGEKTTTTSLKASIGTLAVQSLLEHQSVTLQDVSGGLSLLSCAGAVWVEDCSFNNVTVTNSATLTLLRSKVTGSNGVHVPDPSSLTAGKAALVMSQGSSVFAMDTTLQGGNGTTNIAGTGASAGGDAVNASGGVFYASGCTLKGGAAGSGFVTSTGGDALQTSATQAFLMQCSLLPGAGSPPGMFVNGGGATFLPGAARHASVTSPVHEGQAATWSFFGKPGDLVGLFFSRDPGVGIMLPLFQGAFVVALQDAHFLTLTTTDEAGSLSLQLPVGNLPVSVQGTSLATQAVFFELSSGAILLAPASMLIVLDQSL